MRLFPFCLNQFNIPFPPLVARNNTYVISSDRFGYLHRYEYQNDDYLQFSRTRTPAHFRFINQNVLQEIKTGKCLHSLKKHIFLNYDCDGSNTIRFFYNANERYLKDVSMNMDVCMSPWRYRGPQGIQTIPGLSDCSVWNKITLEIGGCYNYIMMNNLYSIPVVACLRIHCFVDS